MRRGEGATPVDFTSLSPTSLGPAAILAVVALMVFGGFLVPKRTVDRSEAQWSERVTDLKGERDTWREAWLTSEETRKLVADLLGDLVDASKVTLSILDALPRDRGEQAPRPPPREGQR